MCTNSQTREYNQIPTISKNFKPHICVAKNQRKFVAQRASIILPEKRTGQECKNNPIKTLYKYGQQFKKEAFLRVQAQGDLRGVERTNDIAGA